MYFSSESRREFATHMNGHPRRAVQLKLMAEQRELIEQKLEEVLEGREKGKRVAQADFENAVGNAVVFDRIIKRLSLDEQRRIGGPLFRSNTLEVPPGHPQCAIDQRQAAHNRRRQVCSYEEAHAAIARLLKSCGQ